VRVLVVNAGSSSLKLRLLGAGDELLDEADVPAPRAEVDDAAVTSWLERAGAVDAVGHRVVHGGERFREPTRIDAAVVEALRGLTALAPLHQPKSLAALEAVQRALPGTPAVACFDTAFHSTLPTAAATYAVPAAWRERWGVRRYGFHGLSHAYASRRAADLLGAPAADLRLVTCHLGAGASLCAVSGGRSVDTTMGFTPLEGLVMATRSGSVDPGLLLWLLERERVEEAEMAEALEHSSGLLALAGTADMRELLERDDAGAQLALGVYVHRLRAGIASMAAALGGADAIVFTGGVGENSPEIRRRALEGLGFLDARELVVPAREDLEIARQVRSALRP
jgi:acetate kinase